ncbi:hypothetical protein LDENG_00258770 [Lucifuga dentata]|nr:hypothetical protein LDENG_00258770 [Lucifuga dentata]
MTRSFLFLNVDKTEMLILGLKKRKIAPEEISVNFDHGPIKQSSAARNLGVTFDADLPFSNHTNNITMIVYFHLHNISRIRPFLSVPDSSSYLCNL